MANFIGKFNSVSIPRPSNITKKLNVPRPKVERNQRLEKQRAINFLQCSKDRRTKNGVLQEEREGEKERERERDRER